MLWQLLVVALTVDLQSYRETPADYQDLFRKLIEPMVTVVPAGQPADGTLAIQCTEKRAGRYRDSDEYGTAQTCRLALTADGIKLVETFKEDAAYHVLGYETPYHYQLRQFREREHVKLVGHWVAAGLGHRPSLEKLSAGAVAWKGVVRRVAAARRWTLEPLEQARVLVSEHKLEACVPLGAIAIAPLLATHDDHAEFGPVDRTRALRAIGKIGGPEAIAALSRFVGEIEAWMPIGQLSEDQVVVALEELVRLSPSAAQPHLGRLAISQNPKVAKAVATALVAMSN